MQEATDCVKVQRNTSVPTLKKINVALSIGDEAASLTDSGTLEKVSRY